MSAWIVFKKEILNFFRDKNTIIYSIILPVALYPLLFWFMNQIFTLQQGTLSDMPTRIAFTERPDDELVFLMYETDYDMEILEKNVSEALLATSGKTDFADIEVDAVIHFAGVGCKKKIEIYFDSSSDRSNEAKDRLQSIIEQYNLTLLSRKIALSRSELPIIQILSIDLSSTESRSRFILGILLPMIIVIITVMGGLYPAIEVITSERERKTIETTLVSPINETSLIIGKFGAVIAMSTMSGLLNVLAMILTLSHTLFGGMLTNFEFSIPLSAFPMIVFGIVLIAATFGALMILVAAFAQDFKEAQSLVSPIYAIGIQPAVVAAIPGIPFNNITALIPVTNISLMFRALIQGNLTLMPALITLGSLLLWCFLFLYLAKYLLRRDSMVLGLDRNQIKQMFRFKKYPKGVRS
ncbi:ABC transporter permease subunit [bacterium]|nr:ABC transporter permease subunit [bacterium]